MICIDTTLLHVASLFTSRETTRYYLGGVYIQPHKTQGITLTATDGHKLIHLYDERGACDAPVILRAMPTGRQLKPGKRMAYRVANGNVLAAGKFTLGLHDFDADGVGHLAGSLLCELIDGSFPEYRRVIPAYCETGLSGQFNPAILSAITEAASELGAPEITYTQSEPKAPALALLGPRAIAVAMPMRTDKQTMPTWY